ncbi:MAG: hypothetical protein U0414_08225 [Polyangiaceae bacterium]
MANADAADKARFAGLLCRSGSSQFAIPRPSVSLILDIPVTAPLPLAKTPLTGFAVWRTSALLICSFYPLPAGCRQRTVALLAGEPTDTFALALAIDHIGASVTLERVAGPLADSGLGALFGRALGPEGQLHRTLDVARLRGATCAEGERC